jgi:hypothetical protein
MALYQVTAKKVQDHVHGVATFTALTTPMKVRAFTASPTVTGGGTQVAAGGGYATGGMAMAWDAATLAIPSVSQNQAATWTNWPRVETVVAIDVTDSAGTPNTIEFGALSSSKVMGIGDSLSLSAGAVTSALS